MLNLHLKQMNHRVLSGCCNEPCKSRVTQQLRRNEEGRKRWNSVGFESGVSNPALLKCEKVDASMVVHGDDFITLGDDEALCEVEHVMSSHYTMRALLGVSRDDAKEVRILNRYVRWNSDGVSMNRTLDTLS